MSPLSRLRLFAATALLACACCATASAPPWAEAPYSYFAQNARLENVLADFATGFGLSLALPPDVGGTVNGRLAANSPTEFLSKLASAYGFVWYTHGGTLFISRAGDTVTRGLAAPGGNVAAMRKALTDLGVLEPRFGWGELTGEGMALVSGPPSYVNLIEATIRQLPARAHQLMVFRLNHASATDRVVSYRDQSITTPGIATLLRAMVSGPGAIASVAASPVTTGTDAPLRPAPSLGNSPSEKAPAATQPTNPAIPAGTRLPSIQADPRINAVIIQDLPERLPLYQQVIAQLDVPTALVEIEALIIDISDEKASELGVSWNGRLGRTSFGFGQSSGTPGIGNFAFSGNFGAASFLLSQLHALENKGAAEVQARPSVLTSENLAAVLDLSETFYIRSQGEGTATITPVTAGTSLRVTPHVLRQDGRVFVQMKIDIEDGQITDYQIDTLPTVTQSTVSTEATLPQGEVLLIAGYKSNRDIKSRQQLPLLGDIPFLGAIFSNQTRSVQKRDRMILIRPRVIESPEQTLGRTPTTDAPPKTTDNRSVPDSIVLENGVRLSLTGSLSIKPREAATNVP